MKYRRTRPQRKAFTIGGILLLALVGVLNTPRHWLSARAPRELCQTFVQPKSALTRSQLSRILTLPERSPKSQIRQIIPAPYCQLPKLEVRAGVITDREAYPLAFDTQQTWLILLYEGEEYAGYAFSFQP